jgi:cytochrome c2
MSTPPPWSRPGPRGASSGRATLDAFLADPYDVVPGTATGMPPLADPDARRDVID